MGEQLHFLSPPKSCAEYISSNIFLLLLDDNRYKLPIPFKFEKLLIQTGSSKLDILKLGSNCVDGILAHSKNGLCWTNMDKVLNVSIHFLKSRGDYSLIMPMM